LQIPSSSSWPKYLFLTSLCISSPMTIFVTWAGVYWQTSPNLSKKGSLLISSFSSSGAWEHIVKSCYWTSVSLSTYTIFHAWNHYLPLKKSVFSLHCHSLPLNQWKERSHLMAAMSWDIP
jgi:hypothetical protein